MSTINRFCAKARRAANAAADKINELVDSAAAGVRKKALEIRIDEQYEALGRVIYRDLHTEENLEEEKLEIIAAIDALYDELALYGENEAEAAPAEEATEAEEPETPAE